MVRILSLLVVLSLLVAGGLATAGPPSPVGAAWTPMPNWPTRAAQTATARAGLPATATPTPRPTSTPAPTSTPHPTATATPTPTPRIGGLALPPVVGSETFRAAVAAAVEQIHVVAPDEYAVYAGHVKRVQEGDGDWASADGTVQIASWQALDNGVGLDWLAGTLVHEARHVYNFDEGRVAVGCAGEADSLTHQANYLDRLGDRELATYTRDLIGTWC